MWRLTSKSRISGQSRMPSTVETICRSSRGGLVVVAGHEDAHDQIDEREQSRARRVDAWRGRYPNELGQNAPVGLTAMAEEVVYQNPTGSEERSSTASWRACNRLGISVQGSRRWPVRGRRAGRCAPTRSNPFELDGKTYCCRAWHDPMGPQHAGRGEGELRRGRKVRHFHAAEVPDSEKLPLMRLYMDKWSWEVKGFLGIDCGRAPTRDRADPPGPPGVRAQLRPGLTGWRWRAPRITCALDRDRVGLRRAARILSLRARSRR